MTIGMLLGAGCDFLDFSDSNADSSNTGHLEVRASTSGVDLDPDDYEVEVLQSWAPLKSWTKSVPPNGKATFKNLESVEDADYTVRLSDIAPNCVVREQPYGWVVRTADRSISVEAGKTVSVVFRLNCMAKMDWMQVEAGGQYTCGLAGNGTLYCWGTNSWGQLGDGTTDSREKPGEVVGDYSFAGLSTGKKHTCGVADSGAVFCWGSNTRGQLGDGTTTSRSEPTMIGGTPSLGSIDAATRHTCGISAGETVYCWGANDRGQLGDGTTTDRSEPTEVTGAYSFAQVSAGQNHTCGVTSGGAAYCWGANDRGQLGDGTTTDHHEPTQVQGDRSFTRISAGSGHSCGMVGSGNPHCWGGNDFGQLGDGKVHGTTDDIRREPVRVKDPTWNAWW